MFASRHLSFPHLLNARDMGGCLRRDGTLTRTGQLIRADELGRLTPEGVSTLIDYGVRTILDLRWPDEAAQRPSLFQQTQRQPPHQHIGYIHVSMLGPSGDYWDNLRPPVVKETWNNVVLDLAQTGLRNAMQAIANAPAGSMLFHCYSGKDRTGILAALLLDLVDVQPEVIAADYAITTERLREAYLAQFPDERAAILESVRCPEENIYNMLEHLRTQYGGSISYLQHIGLQGFEIDKLCKRLTIDD